MRNLCRNRICVAFGLCVFGVGILILMILCSGSTCQARTLEPEDNSSYDFGEDQTQDSGEEDKEEEDLEGKIVITVRKPTDFQSYSKQEGIFIVRAKHKGEISGYDIRLRKADSDTATNYHAVTTHNLFRRFVGGEPDSKYKVKVRAFLTVNGKDYPSRWTKERQVIVWPRSDDGTPSGTRLHDLGRDKTEDGNSNPKNNNNNNNNNNSENKTKKNKKKDKKQ